MSTATGAGADVELREQSNNTSNGSSMNTRTSSGGDRNEIIGLRFDLNGYTLANLTNVALELVSFRTNDQIRLVNFYGVKQGVAGGTGAFTTETWSDSGLSVFGDMPGLDVTDGDYLTQSIRSNDVTYLGQLTFPVTPEGGSVTFSNAALGDFLRNHAGSSRVTFLLAAGNNSTGQARFATREATQLTTAGLFTGPAGTFAPRLHFDVLPGLAGLRITNVWREPAGIALAGLGGTSNRSYVVLTATNLVVPVTNWSAVNTNNFDGAGRFLSTNPVVNGAAHQFFRLLEIDRGRDFGLVGFATVNGNTTGGAGGSTQTVSTASAFISAVGSSSPLVVQVSGGIDLNGAGTGSANINSHKTIIGLGTNAWISGQLQISGRSNVIIRNLSISNNAAPGDLDGVRIVNGSHHIWVDHCTFVDCSDGELDITLASDFITVSWCKFYYTRDNGHNFANLIAASDTDAGNYRITFHHNWWSTLAKQRMPMSRYGTVHLFNNFYHAPGNSYCSNARTNAQFLSEHNYYRSVNNPIYKESNGRIRTVGNIYDNCTGLIDPGTSTLDPVLTPPPYSYSLDPVLDVPSVVTNNAGAGRGPFAP